MNRIKKWSWRSWTLLAALVAIVAMAVPSIAVPPDPPMIPICTCRIVFLTVNVPDNGSGTLLAGAGGWAGGEEDSISYLEQASVYTTNHLMVGNPNIIVAQIDSVYGSIAAFSIGAMNYGTSAWTLWTTYGDCDNTLYFDKLTGTVTGCGMFSVQGGFTQEGVKGTLTNSTWDPAGVGPAVITLQGNNFRGFPWVPFPTMANWARLGLFVLIGSAGAWAVVRRKRAVTTA